MKSILKVIKNLTLALSFKMFWALISKPLLTIPTILATIESILYSQKNFNENHGGQGRANAFRHAAWNLLIARNVLWYYKEDKASDWAKYLTDLHEEVFRNQDFDRLMDLHNNKIGRDFFLELIEKNVRSKKEMIKELVNKSTTAVGLLDEKEFENYPTEMVFNKNYKS